MKTKLLIIIILLIFSNSISAQLRCEYKIEFEEKVMNEDLIFIEEILGDGEWKLIQNRIIYLEQKDNILELKIGITSLHEGYSNCNVDFKDEKLFIEFIPTKSIDEVLENYTSYREVNLKIEGLKTTPKKIYFKQTEIFVSKEKYKTFPEKFEIIGNDTLNRFDKYGQRQGKWIDKFASTEIESHYVDSKLIKGEIRTYYENGKLESQYFKDDFNAPNELYYRGYYESGEVKEENYQIYRSPGKFKIMWHSNKNIFQENYYDGEQIIIKQFKKNGELDCECITKIGTDYFKGWVTDYTTNEFQIPCKYFDNEGNELKTEEKVFKLHYDIKPK